MLHRIVVLAALLVLPLAGAAKAPKHGADRELEVIESHHFNIPEISGMCWRRDPHSKQRQLVIVGDKTHSLYVVNWDDRQNGKIEEFPLAELVPDFRKAGSQWESVVADESGRVFILQENPARVFVTSPDLKSIERVIRLEIPKKGFERVAWNKDLNSRGEGLILLKNGNILVVKEKKPLKVLEFSADGASAEGYRPELAMEWAGVFPLPGEETSTYTARAFWALSSRMVDSSGINLDPRGRPYLLGDKESVIRRISGAFTPEVREIDLGVSWKLPAVAVKPEGMVIDEQMRPVIGLDQKKPSGMNLFVLSPLIH